MLYRVQKIDEGGVSREPALISEAAIHSVRKWDLDGHEDVVVVSLPENTAMYCVGTIDTFATPWEPEKKQEATEHSEIQKYRELLWSGPEVIRRAKPGIEEGPFFEGQPDEEPDKDARWLRGRAAAERHYRDVSTTEERASRFEAIARRLEGLSSYVVLGERESAWHSVDEPPEHGTWCWVTDGKATWLVQRGIEVEGKRHDGWHYAKGPVTGFAVAWQPANVPEVPKSEETGQ